MPPASRWLLWHSHQSPASTFNFEFAPTFSRLSAQGFDVKYVTHLARLALTPEEEENFQAQLGNILGYIAKLNELDVANVEPTAHALPR